MPAGSPLLLWLALFSQASACLLCFSSAPQRLRICQQFLGHHSARHAVCLEALQEGFRPHTATQVGECRPAEHCTEPMEEAGACRGASDVQHSGHTIADILAGFGRQKARATCISVSEIEKLKDTFARIVFYLEEKGMAAVPYRLAIQEAAEHIKKELAELKDGFQREARRFQCSSCSIVDCQLPIDCPVQDVHKQEGDGTLLSCEVKFQIPTDSTFRWKFAKDLEGKRIKEGWIALKRVPHCDLCRSLSFCHLQLRTEDLSLFQDLQFGFSRSLLIQPTLGSHHGTIACEIAEEEDVLIRKFYYLNVTEKRTGLEKRLQDMFKAILNPPVDHQREEAEGVVVNRPPSLQEMLSAPDALSKKNVILLISGIALSSMALTLAALTIYHWATGVTS
ncbi:sperm acrosome membrane-associated protein 6-like [Varanus komodoensis]|uniref:sperm acrosome membrane-associated protein 6-like n=1 Tax=Varanus komodoensis TaxID=61221 RepID=UPI001CF7A852|nr:sperm acrosome membrane-associated protein 6-like [Varanus komodoensis]